MTTTTQNLEDWLLEQIAADEQRARMRIAVLDALPPHERAAAEAVRASMLGGEPWDMPTFAPDPARVLAECEAKRRIVALHQPNHEYGEPACVLCQWDIDCDAPKHEHQDGAGVWPCPTLRALAQPYRDAPGWREEWAL